MADGAYTLKEGRRAFEKRRVVVAESHEAAAAVLEGADTRRVFNHDFLGENPEVVFMFPGGGAQYAGMARDLYETEPVFADWMDKGLAVLEPQLDYDIRALWLPAKGAEAKAPGLSAEDVRKATMDSVRALMMIRAYRMRGHLHAKLDPLGIASAVEEQSSVANEMNRSVVNVSQFTHSSHQLGSEMVGLNDEVTREMDSHSVLVDQFLKRSFRV